MKWNPDSRSIYFLHKQQVWRVSMQDGAIDPVRISHAQTAVKSFDVAVDDAGIIHLYYVCHEGNGPGSQSRIYHDVLNSDVDATSFVIDSVARELAVSPSRRYIAIITTPDETLFSHEGWSELHLYETAAGTTHCITPPGWRDGHRSPYGWLTNLNWLGDGEALAFAVGYDGYPPLFYSAEIKDGQTTLAKLNRPATLSPRDSSLHSRAGSRDLYFLAQEKGYQRLYCVPGVRGGQSGPLRTITPGNVVIGSYSVAADGAAAVVQSSPTRPNDIYLYRSDRKPARLTNINPQIDSWKVPQMSLVQWKGADGKTIEGVLELPPDYRGDTPLPMIVYLHGGPTSSNLMRMRFFRGRVLLAAQGYAVFCPNYRGSTGYGDRFIEELIGNNNGIEVKDVLSGIETMVDRGIADPNKIGVKGWSYGGYLTNCLITHSDRFKAAITGASIVDMNMQWGLMDTPGWVINFMGGLPWEKPNRYRNASPLHRLNRVTAATLIQVGERDPRCPPANAYSLHRALKHYRNVDTQLMVFPGEGHHLNRYEHLVQRMQWDLAWFDKYLRCSTAPLPKAVE